MLSKGAHRRWAAHGNLWTSATYLFFNIQRVVPVSTCFLCIPPVWVGGICRNRIEVIIIAFIVFYV
jgi:hypothetical protein